MKRVGVDIDEVLSETVKAFLKFYNKKHFTHFQFNHITEYSFTKVLNISPEIEKAELIEFFKSTYFAEMTPVKGSVEALKTLSKNFELYAISSRPQQLITITTCWLEKYFGNIFTKIILIDGHFDTTNTKSATCKQYNIDYFIEDTLVYAEDCANAGVKTFLLKKPWNNKPTYVSDIIQVNTWGEILAYLSTM